MAALIADIGGTNARFSLLDDTGETLRSATLPTADFSDPADAAEAFLAQGNQRPKRAAFAVACPVPVGEDQIRLTNARWDFSIAATRKTLNLDRLDVVNDFVAAALSIPHLTANDRIAIGSGTARPGAPVAALGPGTGLGAALLIPLHDGTWHPVATEAGHATLCAGTDLEAALLDSLRPRLGHISAERLLSGSGLTLLYDTLAGLRGLSRPSLSPQDVTAAALDKRCPLADETLQIFFGLLGCTAGNLALTTGAQGGIWLMGGILPRLVPALQASAFRERFVDKGRFRKYLDPIPTTLVIHPNPGLLGLARWVIPNPKA